MPRQNWAPERRAEVQERWDRGEAPKDIQEAMGLTRGQFARQRINLSLHTPVERRREYSPDNAAMKEGRTFFPVRVTDEGDVLKPGAYQSKLGGRVTKGAWKGFPIFALTLEERKTCPTDCKLWISCYGNGMQYASRMRHGPQLERRLWVELGKLQRRHSRGFVVRLHVLGDFYSVGYVEFWREALSTFPAMRVFGYTARQRSTRIGLKLARMRESHWDRFAIRTSGALTGTCRTMVVERPEDVEEGAILCPVQTNRTKNCGTCSLCWASKKPIAFIRH